MPWRSPARGAYSGVGIYDRDYYREPERRGAFSYASASIVTTLIIVNVAVWLADALFSNLMTEQESWLRDHLAVHAYTLFRPWLWWQFLTAGFDHAADVQHILWNMVGLFIFGREVEQVYGGKEFLRLYLAMVVFASLVWCVLTNLAGAQSYPGRMRWSTGWPWGHPVRSRAWSCFTRSIFPAAPSSSSS